MLKKKKEKRKKGRPGASDGWVAVLLMLRSPVEENGGKKWTHVKRTQDQHRIASNDQS